MEQDIAIEKFRRAGLREELEFLGLSLAMKVVAQLPYEALQPFANFCGAVASMVDRRGWAVSLANLHAAFGDSLTPGRKRGIARASYQAFARTMLELFWSPNLTPEKAEEIIITDDRSGTLDTDEKRPVICVCLHAANFEWLSQFTAFHGGKAMVVTQNFENPLLGPLFDRLRRSTGHEVIPQEKSFVRMFKHLKRDGRFHVVVDLNLDPREPSVIIDQFGGLKTCVTQIHAALAQRTGAVIIPSECRPLPDGRYRMTLREPLEFSPGASATEIVQKCWDVLENSIREQPECWLWSYKHWRFRPSNDQSGRYPYYANTAKRFDKLLAQQQAVSI